MTKLLLRIHDYLTAHRLLAIVSLLVLLAVGVVLALQLRYEENIADFLPRSKDNVKQAAVYNALGDQGQITVIFRPSNEADDDEVMDAIDLFAETFTTSPVQAAYMIKLLLDVIRVCGSIVMQQQSACSICVLAL